MVPLDLVCEDVRLAIPELRRIAERYPELGAPIAGLIKSFEQVIREQLQRATELGKKLGRLSCCWHCKHLDLSYYVSSFDGEPFCHSDWVGNFIDAGVLGGPCPYLAFQRRPHKLEETNVMYNSVILDQMNELTIELQDNAVRLEHLRDVIAYLGEAGAEWAVSAELSWRKKQLTIIQAYIEVCDHTEHPQSRNCLTCKHAQRSADLLSWTCSIDGRSHGYLSAEECCQIEGGEQWEKHDSP